MKILVVATLSISLLNGCVPSKNRPHSEIKASESECASADPSTQARCEGINFLQRALRGNAAVNAVGLSIDLQKIAVLTQVTTPEQELNVIKISKALLEIHLSSPDKISISGTNGDVFYNSTNGLKVRVVTEVIGLTGPGL